MNTRTEDGARGRNGTPSVRTRIVPEFSAAFWTNWLLAAMAGEIAGRALNQIYPHHSGRVIVALMLCFLAMSILQGATRRLPRMTFWSAAFLLSLLGAVLARAADISMGGGDIGAILLIAILVIFKSYDNIVDHCCYAWNTLIDQPWKIISIALRDWAYIGRSI